MREKEIPTPFNGMWAHRGEPSQKSLTHCLFCHHPRGSGLLIFMTSGYSKYETKLEQV